MSNQPLRINALGFISAISRTILAIATIGLIDASVEPSVSSGGGGGSGDRDDWGSQPVSYPHYYAVQSDDMDMMDIVMAAYSAGGIVL